MRKLKPVTLALLAMGLIVPNVPADDVIAPAPSSLTLGAATASSSDESTEPAKLAETQTADSQTAESQTDASEPKVEVVHTRYPNREIKIERHVAQDAELNYYNHGTWTMWSPEGEVVGSGEYQWGKRHGKWTRLLNANESGRHTADAKAGFDLPFVSTANFVDGEIHGTWLIVDSSNRKVRSWQFDHGALHGESVAWFPSGKRLRVANYENGVPDGEHQELSEDGKVVERHLFKDGQLYAPHAQRYASGAVESEGHYLHARDVLTVKIDWWDGVVKFEVSGKQGENVKHGRWVHNYEDGAKAYEGEFTDGRPRGRHQWWYANGQKRIEGSFLNGKPDGHWVWWHENGLKQMAGHYVEGVQDQKWVRWADTGKVVQVEEHTLLDSLVDNASEADETTSRQPQPRTANKSPDSILQLRPADNLRR